MGSTVRQDANAYLMELIRDLQSRINELEENALTSWDIVAETLRLGEPTTTPGDVGDASLAGNLDLEGALNVGTPVTPAALAGNAAISGNLSVEGTISGTGTVTGGDSHDHVGGDGAPIVGIVTGGNSHDHAGGDGAVIPETGLAAAVSAQLVTGGDSHDHAGGDGGAIDTGALADGAVTTDKIENSAVDINKLAYNTVYDHHIGYRVPMFPRREGGSSSKWETSGTSSYTPTTVKMQCGSFEITIGSGDVWDYATISFPQSFAEDPLVIVSCEGSGNLYCKTNGASTSGVEVIVWRDAGNGSVDVDIHWLAIGPE